MDPWFDETRSAFPASLGANSSLLLFWLDVFVAPETPAGNYSATVTVSFGGALLAPVAVPLRLRVFGFALASTSSVYKSTYGLSSEGIPMVSFHWPCPLALHWPCTDLTLALHWPCYPSTAFHCLSLPCHCPFTVLPLPFHCHSTTAL